MADLRLVSEMPDYRAEPMATPEGGGNASARFAAWASDHLDPIVEPPAEGYGRDRLAEVDRDRMAARVIAESELIGFWLAWHRAGGFAGLERGGWDRSTIFRKVRRFRSYFQVHPDDARFPWLAADWERAWAGDRLVALEWASEHGPHGGETAPPSSVRPGSAGDPPGPTARIPTPWRRTTRSRSAAGAGTTLPTPRQPPRPSHAPSIAASV